MRRIMSIVLALLMVFSTIIPLQAQTSGRSIKINTDVKAENNDEFRTAALEQLEAQVGRLFDNGDLDPDEEFNFIIEIEGPTNEEKAPIGIVTDTGMKLFSTSSYKKRSNSDLKSFVERRIDEQNIVLNKIFESTLKEDDGTGYSIMSTRNRSAHRDNGRFADIRRFKALLNGFVLEKLTYEQAREIAKTPGVKRVTCEVKLNRPKVRINNQAPQMHYSRELVKASQSVARGYDGRGRVIAILDSGADVNHKDLIIKEHGTVKLTENMVNDIIRKNSMRGRYFNEKFPYGYNYFDKDFNLKDTNPDLGMHGQHIAGTIAGNGDLNDPASTVGIVPEAQILVMRVFGEKEARTGTSTYTEALDDAVLLGADGVNMSLGSIAGTVENDPVFEEAVQKAREAGVLVAIANGNDGYSFSGAKILPGAENVEWSTAGAPATMRDSLAVASFNNDHLITENSLEYNQELLKTYPMSSIDDADFSRFELGKEYDFVDVGLGNTDDDYNGKDLNGKIALAQRGGASFIQKIEMAMQNGAIAVLIGDNGPAGDGSFTMATNGSNGRLVPSYFISLANYNKLKEGALKKVKITKNPIVFESSVKGMMSSFSSWGPTASLEMKPEITAPGGDIRSTLNDNKYGYMSGTSMATPHVTGGISVAMKRLEDLNLARIDTRFDYAKSLLMLTADPIKIPGSDNLYYSPRWQGAGLMNLDKLTASNFVFITDNGPNISRGKSKVELQNISKNSISLDLNLRNFSNKAVRYEVYAQVQTDLIKNGENTLTPDILLENTRIGEVQLSPKGNANFVKDLDFNSKNYESLAPNGYFIDAFVFFKPVGDGEDNFKTISIPVLAFKGDYSKAPVIEKFIDEFDLAKEKPLWFRNKKLDWETTEKESNFTHFVVERRNIASGKSFEDTMGRIPYSNKFTSNFAISPNGDGYQDFVKFRGVFLRNYTNFGLRIFDENKNEVKFIQNPWRKDGRKVYNTVNGSKNFSQVENVWSWDGTDLEGRFLPDGKYFIDVEASPGEFKESRQRQVIRKEILIDTVEPTIKSASAEEVENELVLRATGVSDDSSGIYGVYMVQDDDWLFELVPDSDGNWIWKGIPNEKFTLDTSKVVFKAVDWAGNISVLDLNAEDNDGSLTITRTNDKNSKDIPNNLINVYMVSDDGEVYKRPITNLNKLSNGKYIAEFRDLPSGYNYEFIPSNEFEITDDNKNAQIEVKFERIDSKNYATLNVQIIWAVDYNGEIKLYAIDETGKKYQLSRRLEWTEDEYTINLPEGKYEIVAEGQNKFFDVNMENNHAKIELKAGVIEYIKMQAIWRVWEMPIFVESTDPAINIFDIFTDEDFEPMGNGLVLKNPEKFFEITNLNTGTSLFDSTSHWYNDNFRPGMVYAEKGDSSIKFWIVAPTGEYRVKFTAYDVNKIIADHDGHAGEFVSKPYSPEAFKNKEVEWKGVLVYSKSIEKGSLVIEEGFIGSDDNKNEINPRYELVDALNNPISIENLRVENLSEGLYSLKVSSDSQNWKPEKSIYDVKIEAGEVTNLLVRWEDISKNTKKRANVVVSMVGEKPPVDEFTVRFTDQSGKVIENVLKMTEGERKSTTLLNQGVYDFELLGLPSDYRLELQWISNGDIKNINNRNTSMTIVVDESWYSIEYAIRKQEITEEFESSLFIRAIGLNNKRAKYRLVGKDTDIEQDRASFLNLKPGKYTLYVQAPEGYLDISPRNIIIKKGKNTHTIVFQEESVLSPGGNFYEPSPEYLNKNTENKKDKQDEKERTEQDKDLDQEDKIEKNFGVEVAERISPLKFDDVSEEEKEIVDFVTSYQIMKGTSQGKFEPQTPISRAMVVEMLMRIAKDKSISDSVIFNDVNVDDWFKNSVYWAATHGYVLGDGLGNFKPNSLVTRQELALILYRFLQKNGIELENISVLNTKDMYTIPNWSIEAVKAMVETDLIRPNNEENYNSDSIVTRLELARAFKMIVEWVEKAK